MYSCDNSLCGHKTNSATLANVHVGECTANMIWKTLIEEPKRPSKRRRADYSPIRNRNHPIRNGSSDALPRTAANIESNANEILLCMNEFEEKKDVVKTTNEKNKR